MADKGTKFHLGITDSLLITICSVANCSTSEVVQFFVSQTEKLLELPGNISARKRYSEVAKTKEIWVQRGYYPGTDIFFKISGVRMLDDTFNIDTPVVKISSPEGKFKQFFSDTSVRDALADNLLVGAELKLKLRKQRCLTPKGLKKFGAKPQRRKRAS